MTFKVIVTIGPSILNREPLRKIASLGPCIYRINGAHVNAEQAVSIISRIRDILPDAEIMVDLPGNKVRTYNLFEPIPITKGEHFSLYREQFNYPDFLKHIKPGDLIHANDSRYQFEVISVDSKKAKFLSLSNGILHNNKGFHIQGLHQSLPFLLPKDIELIDVAQDQETDLLSLSFVRKCEDIEIVKSLLPANHKTQLIAKIETKMAVSNLSQIMESVENLNVDRGDLATDVGLTNLPRLQEEIIKKARAANKKIFLATQFLKSMEENPLPLISEAIGLEDVIRKKIQGIQLSEETAIGKYPVECVKFVFDLYHKSLAR